MTITNRATFFQSAIAGLLVLPSIPVVSGSSTSMIFIIAAVLCALFFLQASLKAYDRNGWLPFFFGLACGFSACMLIIGKAIGDTDANAASVTPYFAIAFVVTLVAGFLLSSAAR